MNNVNLADGLPMVSRPFAAALLTLDDNPSPEALVQFEYAQMRPVHLSFALYVAFLIDGHEQVAAHYLKAVERAGLEAAAWEAYAHLKSVGLMLLSVEAAKRGPLH